MRINTPFKAMRLKCLDCSCFQPREVEKCVIPECTLYPYRFGKRPHTAEKHLKRRGEPRVKSNPSSFKPLRDGRGRILSKKGTQVPPDQRKEKKQ